MKKTMFPTLMKAFLSGWILFAISCNPEERAWEKALKTNTAASYEEYLKRYPGGQGKHHHDATQRLEFQKVLAADTIDDLEVYLKEWTLPELGPPPAFREIIRDRLSKLYVEGRHPQLRGVRKVRLRIQKAPPIPDSLEIPAAEWLHLAGVETTTDETMPVDAVLTIVMEGKALAKRYMTNIQRILAQHPIPPRPARSSPYAPFYHPPGSISRPSGTTYYSGATLQGRIMIELTKGERFEEIVPLASIRPPENISVREKDDPMLKPGGAPFGQLYFSEYHVDRKSVSFNTRLGLLIRRTFGLPVIAKAFKTGCSLPVKKGAACVFLLEGEAGVPVLLSLLQRKYLIGNAIYSDRGLVAWMLGELRAKSGFKPLWPMRYDRSLIPHASHILPPEVLGNKGDRLTIGDVVHWAVARM